MSENAADYHLGRYDWKTSQYERIPGSADWELVAEADSIGGYEWDILAVFWSPTARRYFWGDGSGCSCNSFRDEFDSASDFSDGDRDAVIRAIRAWRDDTEWRSERRTAPAAELEAAIRQHARVNR